MSKTCDTVAMYFLNFVPPMSSGLAALATPRRGEERGAGGMLQPFSTRTAPWLREFPQVKHIIPVVYMQGQVDLETHQDGIPKTLFLLSVTWYGKTWSVSPVLLATACQELCYPVMLDYQLVLQHQEVDNSSHWKHITSVLTGRFNS